MITGKGKSQIDQEKNFQTEKLKFIKSIRKLRVSLSFQVPNKMNKTKLTLI